jgi:hypothetical protein
LTRLLIAAWLLAAPVSVADTIDRIAVSVGNRVITTSDIERQIRVAAFLSEGKIDLSAANRRKTAEALVDQALIRRELETARYPEPSPADLEGAFAEFRKKYYPTDEAYRRALATYGVTEEDVKEQLHWQRTWMSFIGVRFHPAAGVSGEEVQAYFEKTVAPAARVANPGSEPSLDDYYDQIQSKLMGDRVDEQMDLWLKDARRRTDVVYHEEAFQ